jgi:asparagine synthase (glutamine-hydrolysing)
MEFGYTFDEHRTMFAGVRKLPPGHRLEVRGGRATAPLRHFTPPLDTRPAAEGPAIESALHDTLGQVVREQLSADVPVALLLSGGLDSSLLAALAARQTRLHTFSFGFAESAVDERPQARQVARHLGTEHEEILISPDDLLEDLDEAVAHFDDLFADWGLVSTRLVYRRCRERGAKVVLVGEGADELFAGYEGRFRPGLAAAGGAPMDWRLFRLYRRYIGRRYGSLFPRWRRRMREHLAATGGDLFAAIRLFETRDQLPNNFVMKVDKASMAASVEARVPFLDARVARIAYQVPGKLALGAAGTKLVLRSMARRYRLLPDAFIERGKLGAGIATSWLDTSPRLRRHAREVVLGGNSWVDVLGLRRAMTAYFHHGRSGFAFPHAIGIFSNVAWRLVLLNLWSRRLDLPPPHG